MLDPCIGGRAAAAIAIVIHQRCARELYYLIRGVIGRAVVDDNDLVIIFCRVHRLENAGERFTNTFLFVVGGNNDADELVLDTQRRFDELRLS